MSKLAQVAHTLSAVHPNRKSTASQFQRHTNQPGVTAMTKLASLTIAMLLFVPVAAIFLHNAALMVA
ncbi:MAG: hypothetical protein ABL883_13895 [Terricaulis sp.]